MIRDDLTQDPDAVCCLALTCRHLFWTLAYNGRPPRVEGKRRTSFLELLERDLSHNFYFCDNCSKLHRFDRSWGPTNFDSIRNWCGRYVLDNNYRLDPYYLGYHHLRLVMLNHLYGPTKGIPLQNLEKDILIRTRNGVWRQQWSARIISNELLLRAHHTLEARDEEQLRQALDMDYYRICRHIDIDSDYMRQTQGPQFSSRPAPLRSAPLVACRDMPGSCARCLTDYTLTIETPEAPTVKRYAAGAKWRLCITAYHHVGNGSPENCKWLAYISSVALSFLHRDPEGYPPGLVIETWNAAGDGRSLLDLPSLDERPSFGFQDYFDDFFFLPIN